MDDSPPASQLIPSNGGVRAHIQIPGLSRQNQRPIVGLRVQPPCIRKARERSSVHHPGPRARRIRLITVILGHGQPGVSQLGRDPLQEPAVSRATIVCHPDHDAVIANHANPRSQLAEIQSYSRDPPPSQWLAAGLARRPTQCLSVAAVGFMTPAIRASASAWRIARAAAPRPDPCRRLSRSAWWTSAAADRCIGAVCPSLLCLTGVGAVDARRQEVSGSSLGRGTGAAFATLAAQSAAAHGQMPWRLGRDTVVGRDS